MVCSTVDQCGRKHLSDDGEPNDRYGVRQVRRARSHANESE